jgi:hypothetical protein
MTERLTELVPVPAGEFVRGREEGSAGGVALSWPDDGAGREPTLDQALHDPQLFARYVEPYAELVDEEPS